MMSKKIFATLSLFSLLGSMPAMANHDCIGRVCTHSRVVDSNGNFGSVQWVDDRRNAAMILFDAALNPDGQSRRSIRAEGMRGVTDLFVFGRRAGCVRGVCVNDYVVDNYLNYGTVEAVNGYTHQVFIHFTAAGNGDGSRRGISIYGYRNALDVKAL